MEGGIEGFCYFVESSFHVLISSWKHNHKDTLVHVRDVHNVYRFNPSISLQNTEYCSTEALLVLLQDDSNQRIKVDLIDRGTPLVQFRYEGWTQ